MRRGLEVKLEAVQVVVENMAHVAQVKVDVYRLNAV